MDRNAYIVIFAITIFLVLFFGLQFLFPGKEVEAPAERDLPVFSSEECTALGGDIINTLNEDNIYAPSDILGEVEGVRCPCLCIRRQNNSEMFFSD
jgi:hypothetical protein